MKYYFRFDCAIRNNGTKIFDKNRDIITFSLTVLGKTKKWISVEIINQRLFLIDSWNYERFDVKKSKMKFNAVEFMYKELCYKFLASKYEKSNRNITISKILHLTFDILCYLIEKLWHSAQCIDNLQEPWNNPWYRTAVMERQNIIRIKARHVY